MSLLSSIVQFTNANFSFPKLVSFTMQFNQLIASLIELGLKNIFLVALCFILLILILYSNSKINTHLKNKYNLSAQESEKKEYQLYLLFLGLLFPLIEIIFELFEIRPKSLLTNNFIFGCFFLSLFLLSQKSKYIYNKIQNIILFLFYIYFSFLSYNIIFLPNDPIPTYAFITTLFLSYIILKPIQKYWFFVGIVFCYLLTIFAFDLVPFKKMVLLFNFCIVVFVINHIRHIALTKIQEKLNFTNEIVNKGNSLTIATNKKGEVTFCSDTITSILGYEPNEVLGFEFWKLAEDNESTGIDYHTNFVNNSVYVRKLKCKNGEYKFIQWIGKQFSEDSVIGIGQDITNEIQIRNRYESLIQTAIDIIYETDYRGKFTFINDYGIKISGYTKEEFLSKSILAIIRKDYITSVISFYNSISDIEDNFTTLELPVIKKDGTEIWISQNVFIRRNSFGKIEGYSGIARDITLLKNIEAEKAKREEKIQKYNKTLKDIALTNYSNSKNLENTIYEILKQTAITLGVDRTCYWTYETDYIISSQIYDSKKNDFDNTLPWSHKFDRAENLDYFEKLESKQQFVSSDVRANSTGKNDDFIYKNNIFSILDTPVFIDGKITGVISFEKTEKVRNWDNEDINFAKSVADLIVIALSSQMRLEVEQKLAKKSELLLVINKSTNAFLLQKNNKVLIKGIINELGKVIQSERISYFKKNRSTNLFDQKYLWKSELQDFAPKDNELQNIPISEFDNNIENLDSSQLLLSIIKNTQDENIKSYLKSMNPNSILIFPVFVKNELSGFFSFNDSSNNRVWNEDEISILQLMVKNISSSMERNINESIIEESEERFRLLANNMPGTIHLSKYDDKFTKIYLNDQIEKLTGYPKSDFLENKIYLTDLILPEDLENLKTKNKEAFELKKPTHDIYRIRHKNGSIVWVEEFVDSIMKNGKKDFMQAILIDITEKKKNEFIIKEKEFAEAANKAKSEFLANMSHEIRTPLNGIIGYTDLLMNSNLEKTQKKYMNTINQSANILLEVVNDILDFSKIESGKLELNIEKCAIKDIIHQIKELINYQAHSKSLEINYIINDDVPTYIYVDYIRLKQILINLLTNAVKFTHKGKIDLTISALEIQKKQSILRFSVKDTGIGIRENNQKIIFQAFSQEDSSTTKKFGGTGLGLTISNQLLGLMNSKLQIESKFNVGSNFFFDVKLRSSNKLYSSKKIEQEKNISENRILTLDNEEPTILIAEDNKINMLLTKTLVKQIIPKAKIYESSDGEKTLGKALEINPDIVLMDIQMPLINGYEATERLRKFDSFKDTVIIALTAGTVRGEKEKCIEAGMNDYVPKPIVKKTLEDVFEKWLISKKSLL